jgi:transcription antitermination factor NusG
LKTIKRNIEKKWHVFYVQTRHEKKVHQRLLDDGFESFLPLEKKLKQWSQRKKWVEEPLFKAYIFVRIAPYEIMNVLQVPGMVTYVRFAGNPAIIRQKHIDFIKKLLVSQTTFELSTKKYQAGAKIKLETGPFRGMVGLVREIRGSKKLVVDLENIDFSIIVEL